MHRTDALRIAAAMNEAIWLRDNVDQISIEEARESIARIAQYDVFSNRQIQAIANGKVSHQAIAKITGKTDKSGGNLNPGTLELLRRVLLGRATSSSDFDLIGEAVNLGTSQRMAAKLTGVSQSQISKKIKEEHGRSIHTEG